MCIRCGHESIIVLAALLGRENVALTDFTLPRQGASDDHGDETAERRSIVLVGRMMEALLPRIAAEATNAPMSVTERGSAESARLWKELYNGGPEVPGDGTNIHARHLAAAAHRAMWLADVLLLAAAMVEGMLHDCSDGMSEERPETEQVTRLANMRRRIASNIAQSPRGGDATGNPVVDGVIERMRRAGLAVEVLSTPGGRPVGTGPNGEVH